jgi:hypothetical protein
MRMVTMLVLVCAAATLAFGEDKLPELKVPKLAKAPVIDGVLDEDAWKDASQSDVFKLQEGEKPQGRTRVLIGQDDTNLYVAVECFDKPEALKALRAEVTDHDGDGIWDDDDVEIFIDPTGARKWEYYQIIVNPKGVTFDVYVSGGSENLDKTWEPKYSVKTNVGATSWTAEFALPLTIFNRTEKSAEQWTFNVSRNRVAGSDVENTYWSPVFANTSHTPSKFGVLLGMPVKALKAPDNKK